MAYTWSKYLIILVGVVFLGVTVKNVLTVLSLWSIPQSFKIVNDSGDQGVFDPSIEYANEDQGWMAYSSISSGEDAFLPGVNINLATSTKGRSRWVFNQTVFNSKIETYVDFEGEEAFERLGIWRYEMPSLVYTPEDTGREWKIFAYRYFWEGSDDFSRTTGTIVYRETGDIASGQWSEEKWLFSANPYNPPKPYNELVLLHLNVLHPSLNDITSYADPAGFYKDGVLYMTLSAYTSPDYPDRVILIASKDHGQSWLYINDLVTQKDVQALKGYNRFSGAQLIEKDSVPYLLITFGDRLQNGLGSFVLGIKDLESGIMQYNDDGALSILNHFPLNEKVTSPLGGGSSDYHENVKKGLLMSVMDEREKDKPFFIKPHGHEILPE